MLPALRLRVLTYNIHHGEGVDGRLDLQRIARVIADQQPDLVAVQEVDVNARRTGGVDQAAELGRLTGMHVTFGKAIDLQGGQYGQALLSRFPFENVQTYGLPGTPGKERRIAVAATVRPWEEGPAVRFGGTHFDHTSDPTDRLRQADEINRLFVVAGNFSSNAADKGARGSAASVVILAGDFNAEPASETMRRLAAHWWDAAAQGSQELGARQATHPAQEPRRRIDYVLLRPTGGQWRVVSTRVVPETVASDHSPVIAVLEWAGNAPTSSAPEP